MFAPNLSAALVAVQPFPNNFIVKIARVCQIFQFHITHDLLYAHVWL